MLRQHRFTTVAALAIALGAASPAAAQAQDLRAPDRQDAAEPAPDLRAPDNRFGQPSGDTIVPVRTTPRVRIVEVPSSGFEWGDAGIGAAGMLAAVALGAGAGMAGAQRRRSRRMTATR
jgi:hypothetical protein